MYSIGELARISRTTVRALRYYDEISILKPAYVSEGGHRYYDEEAFAKLHYILTLKEIGFELEKIREIMDNQQASPKELLEMRLEMITSEIQELEKNKRTIQLAMQIMEFGGHENWEELFGTFKQSFLNWKEILDNRKKYLTPEEQKKLANMSNLGGNTELNSGWSYLLNDIRKALEQGISPESPEGQKFAERWSALVYEMYDGEWELAQKLWDIQYHDVENIGMINIEKRIVQFIEAAMEYTWAKAGEADE
ncbi:MerR family transcriptional regulator [Virgibacillus doumboii]|uniref:MerR family transcriptional regulator n=1 Tax=Virgibacillus doumboii TaxID=2697503 RepID=UPI0013E068B1|nr:MerR family transcriptional regulator [Virgibacillus doumboii]